MATSFGFFDDPGKATPCVQLDITELTTGETSPVRRVKYLGSNTPGVKLERKTTPGDPLLVTLIGGNATLPLTAFKLALSEGGLSSATAGAALDLGSAVYSSGVVAVWVECDSGIGAVSQHAVVSLKIEDAQEVAA